jgi:D-proline reductase (dithiol) PrdB
MLAKTACGTLDIMATYDEMTTIVRLFMRGYPFRRFALKPTPVAPLAKPLSRARVALITSAGVHLPEQTPFDKANKMGDCSFREIPADVEVTRLNEGHRSNSFDHAGLAADRNLALPLDRFRELAAQGAIGSLNHRHFSFMGSIVGPRPLINETAPEVARLLKADGVDAAFLTPV